MIVRRFRRSRKRWPWFVVVGVTVLVGVRFSQSANDEERINPRSGEVQSGEYPLKQVNDDGSLELLIDTNGRDRVAKVLHLGIEILPESQAVDRLRAWIGDSTIRLRFDRRRTAEDTGDLQAYLFVNDLLLNEELVRHGLAREATHPADAGPMIRRIKKAEVEAREAKRGVWQQLQ